MITRITTYGLPSDRFRRIVEERELRGDVLHVQVTEYLRASVECLTIPVTVSLELPK